jgi:MFS transporter, DHA1 family, multidrug resistance protein
MAKTHEMDPVDRDLEIAEMEATETGEPIERRNTSHSDSSEEVLDIDRAPTQSENLAGMEQVETAMSRIQTIRSQHNSTVGETVRSRLRESRKPLPPMGAGKPYPPSLPAREEYVVEFDGAQDPLHPQNWPMRKKVVTVAILAFTTFGVAYSSSVFSAATRIVAAKFGVSSEVGNLGTSLYVLGMLSSKKFC